MVTFVCTSFLLDEVQCEGIFETKGDFMLVNKFTTNWKESLTEIATTVIN